MGGRPLNAQHTFVYPGVQNGSRTSPRYIQTDEMPNIDGRDLCVEERRRPLCTLKQLSYGRSL
jgi:hypothetical protein